MAFRKKSVQTMVVTPALCHTILSLLPVPGDRAVNHKHVEAMKSDARNGTYTSAVWAQAEVLSEGKTYRVNGQHGGTAMLECFQEAAEGTGAPPCTMEVIYECWICDTPNDLRTVYAGYDSSISSRTQDQLLRMFMAGDEELAECEHHYLRPLPGALTFLADGGKSRGAPRTAMRAKTVVDNKAFSLFVITLASTNRDAYTQKIRRVPALAAVHETWKKNPEQAMEFWSLVMSEEHADVKNPSRMLATYLRELRLSRVGRPTTTLPREVYAKCLCAWNAWRKNTTTALNYYHSKPLPTAH